MKKTMTLVLTLCMVLVLCCACGTKNYTSFTVLDDALAPEEYGVGFRNADIALGLEVQKQIDAMIADGTAAGISEKWFGEDIMIKDAAYYEETEAATTDKSLEKVLEAGKLVMGLDVEFPPMGFLEEGTDETVGFDVDLAREVCSRLGVELVLQPIDWDSKELELNSGNIDCIWSGMTVNEERIASMYFAKPYIENAQVVIVPEGSSIAKVADLAGKKVGLQKGSSALDALEGSEVYANVKKVTEYPDNTSVFMDLKTGRIDAMVVDVVVGRYLIETVGLD